MTYGPPPAPKNVLDVYRETPPDPLVELKKEVYTLSVALQERLNWRDEEYKKLERRVENHFRADLIFIIVVQAVSMIILKIWLGH